MANYEKFLASSYQSGMVSAWCSGLGLGFIMCIMLISYALATWSGAKMILHKGYTGGEAFTIILAVTIGSK